MRRLLSAVLPLDAVLVIVFAAIGRSSHEEGLSVLGVVETAAPFLVGLALGWVLARALRLDPGARGGLVVWVATVAGGMVVRQLAGEGTAFSFIVVASIVLGVFLLASRLVARVASAREHA